MKGTPLQRQIAGKMHTTINEEVVELSNNLTRVFGKINVCSKVINFVRDYSVEIIEENDSLRSIVAEYKTRQGYIAFANNIAVNQVVTFLKNNIALIKELSIKAGWYKEPVIKTKEEPKQPKLFTKRAVICTTTGQKFNSIKNAAITLNCDGSAITKCCRGKRKKTKGLQFEYA